MFIKLENCNDEKIFSRAFKREVAQLVTMRGVSVAQASRDFDVHATVLRRPQLGP